VAKDKFSEPGKRALGLAVVSHAAAPTAVAGGGVSEAPAEGGEHHVHPALSGTERRKSNILAEGLASMFHRKSSKELIREAEGQEAPRLDLDMSEKRRWLW
jgi:hypothetical protein